MNISTKDLNINEHIRAKSVRLIDDKGEQIGVVGIKQALDMAYDRDLDLVEMSAKSDPPVCKIMDYGKYRFERDKKERESRKKAVVVEVKEVKFSCKIGDHDFNTKIRHAIRFLEAGNRLKVSLMFSGREMQHTDLGLGVMKRVEEAISDYGVVEKKPNLEGRFMTMFVAPKTK
ncbi:MAG: translation initiation factor IF-3 [Firmicutes bacterium]|nr:translation initiation factor IF-3 [Bacillota bacterium]